MTRTLKESPWFDAALAWYFVTVMGFGLPRHIMKRRESVGYNH
jgi:hypothetical protein